MKPTIGKWKDSKHRIVEYSGAIGPIKANGKTPNEASAACETAVLDALKRLELGTTIGQWSGHTWIVFPTIDGYNYWLDTFSGPHYSVSSPGSREHAIDKALFHLAQSVWTHAVPDDTAFVDGLPYGIRAELGAYFAWQREYRRLADRGYSDTDARAIIAGFKRETEALSA
jgi:hypothetical protein